MTDIIGTAGDDTLTGTSATETIIGLGGNDTLTDILGGFDTLQGGDGNDTLIVVRGNGISGAVAMEGGEGDDRFFLSGSAGDGTQYLNGGNGNDYFDAKGGEIHGGAGNDTVVYRGSRTFLEAGSDTIYFPGTVLTASVGMIEDFTPGAGGDRVDFGTVLAGLWGWDQSSNPFGTYLRLREVPANGVVVWEFRLDSGAATYQTFMLTNMFDTSLLTAFNLGGYTLNGAAPAAENLTGTAGDDTLTGGVASGTINGLGGNDTISGGAGADQIDGGDGNDVIDAGLGNDTVQGGIGNDTITDNFGFQGTIDGGAGNDLITVDLSTTVQPAGQPIGPAQFTRTINGGNDDDTILVIGPGVAPNQTDFTINGGSGNDRIEVSTGRATIDAGDGNDLIIADIRNNLGATVTLGAGVDTVRVGALLPSAGNNQTAPIVITDFQAGAGGDVIDIPSFFIMRKGLWDYVGNPINGSDARLVQSGADVLVQIHSTGSDFWTIAVLQNRTLAQLHADNFGGFAPDGSPPADQLIIGDGGANTLAGGHGNDTIQSLAGNDTLTGGFGNDLLQGGDDNDTLDGQWANDTLEGGNGNDILLDSLGGNDTLRGGDGNDILTITRSASPNGTLVLEGGNGNDVITAPTGTISGGDGDDVITTTDSQFNISGGTGNDVITTAQVGTIDAGSGNDTLYINQPKGLTGDPPSPTITTLGSGRDAIVAGLHAQITVNDFVAGEEGDRLDLSIYGPDPFRAGGPLLIDQVGADAVIRLRVGGTGPDFKITLLNVQATDLSTYNLTGVDSHVFAPANRTFNGTPGPDTYVSADGNDTLNGLGDNDVLYGAGGNDTINGGSGNDQLFGGSGDDEIDGGSGNDIIEGGTGIDHLYGNAGDDIFFVSDSRAIVTESPTHGRDVVYTEVDFQLMQGAEIEVLSTSSYLGTTPLTLIGNDLVNELYGNAGANYLDGGGGADYMAGFGGNDVYIVDVPGDIAAEAVGEGNHDVVYARGDYVMTAGADIEVLSAISQAATAPIYLVGNERVNEIYGTAGADYLDGGAGVDYLGGFGGNDTYIVETLGDFIIELAGQGRDVVYARANYVLNAGASVEVLSTIQQSATTAIDLTGNELSNEVYGNNGVNTINGGAGSDYLMGFGGADTFAFTTALGASNVDQILDFSVIDDTIALDDAVFAGLAPGALAPGAFVNGTAAGDADDRIIYNSATGQILFDADGNGAGAAVLFATVSAGTALTASDFMVI